MKPMVSMLLWTGALWAQDAVLSPLNLGRHQDISARAMALGGSFTGVANDFAALFYNPAGLSSIRKHEAQFTLEGTRLQGEGREADFPGREGDQENLGIQSFGIVFPVATERGGLSFALGSYAARTFSDVLTFQDELTPQRGPYEYRAEGDLTHYRAGMAIDLSPDAVFGFALSYINGEEQIDIRDVPASRYLRSYGGFSLEPALLFKVTPRWRLGVSLVALERFTVNETYQERGESSLQQEYEVRHPIQLKLGAAYQGPGYLVAADYKAFNWSNYRIGLDDADFLENPAFPNEHAASLGAEALLPSTPILLRAGYAYNTLVGPDLDPTFNIHRVSLGAGFILGGAVDLSAAYALSFWEALSNGVYSENREHRALLTFGYRY